MAFNLPHPNDPWEYKIVRARHAGLAAPDALDRLVREEARAGWTLVDVYGDRWARFARPRTLRRKDALLPRGVDPYRTVYAPPVSGAAWQAIFLAACVALTLIVIVLVAVLANWPAGP